MRGTDGPYLHGFVSADDDETENGTGGGSAPSSPSSSPSATSQRILSLL